MEIGFSSAIFIMVVAGSVHAVVMDIRKKRAGYLAYSSIVSVGFPGAIFRELAILDAFSRSLRICF